MSRTMLRLTALILTTPLAILAFSDTVPLLAWTSPSSQSLNTFPTPLEAWGVERNPYLYDALDVPTVCEFDTVVVLVQPGLHASDLHKLPSSSYILNNLRSAPSSRYVPYLQFTSSDDAVLHIAGQCGSQLLNLELGDVSDVYLKGQKYIMSLTLPEINDNGPGRRAGIDYTDLRLGKLISDIDLVSQSYIVIIIGSVSNSFSKRAVKSATPLPFPFTRNADAFKRSSFTRSEKSSKGGIFQKYQLLTPGLITTLGITFFLVFPLLYFVIMALASIKSPLRSEGIKQSSQERKNQ